MAKQESIEVEGTIKEALPGARFRVTINLGGKEHEVLAHVSGKMRMHFIKMLPGDKVDLQLSPYDLSRGRITCLLYTSPSPRDLSTSRMPSSA